MAWIASLWPHRTPLGPLPLVLALILIVALTIRVIFFVGFAAGMPQDDGIYLTHALDVQRSGWSFLDRYRGLSPDYLANPAETFKFRPLMTQPIALAFTFAGPSESTAAAWPLICSLLLVLVAFAVAALECGPRAGLLAAGVVALYPLDVINGTRILPDVPLALFVGLALAALLYGLRFGSRSGMLLSGLAVGAATLVKPVALILGVLLLVSASLAGRLTRRALPQIAWMVLGLAVVVAGESAFYAWRVGDPLLSLRIHRGAAAFKYRYEPTSNTSMGPVAIEYTDGTPLQLTRAAAGLGPRQTDLDGFAYILFGGAIAWALVWERQLVSAWLALLGFLYFEFGPVDLTTTPTGGVVYRMLFKQERYLAALTAVNAAVGAALLQRLLSTHARTAVVLIALFAACSIYTIDRRRDFYRAGVQDVREIAAIVRAGRPERWFGDFWLADQVRFFAGPAAGGLIVLQPSAREEDVAPGCLVVGGSRGRELVSAYVRASLPAFAQALWNEVPLPGWVEVLRLPRHRDAQRDRDLRIVCSSRAAETDSR